MTFVEGKKDFNAVKSRHWISYCYGKIPGVSNIVQDAILDRLNARKEPFLQWEHFGDQDAKQKYAGCKGDHYHLLVQEDDVSQSSSTPNYSFLKRLAEKYDFKGNLSVMQVRDFASYVKYLSQEPRKLANWSHDLDDAVDAGQFYICNEDDPDKLISDAFKRRPGSRFLPSIRPALRPGIDMGREPTAGGSLTKSEETYQRLVELVRMSGARDSREFVNWGLAQKDQLLRDEICIKYFSKQNFDRLVSKAITMLNLSANQNTWREALNDCTPPSSCHMSRATSREFVDRFCKTNGLDSRELAQQIEKIVDKKSGKINTIIFKGPSNAGKTRLCNSIKFSFKTYADISQGINNNFWLESALGKRIIFHEEAQFNEENQEDVKKLMEGLDMPVHRKGCPMRIHNAHPISFPVTHGRGVGSSKRSMSGRFATVRLLCDVSQTDIWQNLHRGAILTRGFG